MEGLVEGGIVHVVLNREDTKPDPESTNAKNIIATAIVCRPAVIVDVSEKSSDRLSVQVFLNGYHDVEYVQKLVGREFSIDNYQVNFGHLWLESVFYSESKEVGTWHWPERS